MYLQERETHRFWRMYKRCEMWPELCALVDEVRNVSETMMMIIIIMCRVES